jgi:hypothetical protein
MRSIFSFLAAVAFSTAAFAQQGSSEQDHAAHHPEGASAPAPAVQKPPVKESASPARPKASPTPASGGMGMGGDMRKMHDRAHEPGGMHDQMHGKDNKMMGGPMSAMPAASAASK